jgi:hypothetical protein
MRTKKIVKKNLLTIHTRTETFHAKLDKENLLTAWTGEGKLVKKTLIDRTQKKVNLSRKTCWQRPRKHFESGGALVQRGTFVYDQNQTILCRLCSLYNAGNGLYRVFTTTKRALSFQQKRVFIQEILFSFFKWAPLAPWFRGPCMLIEGQRNLCQRNLSRKAFSSVHEVLHFAVSGMSNTNGILFL